MNNISNNFLRLAVVAALCGMVWGIVMGARQDFTPASAHAHLNLLGWVSMSIYGLFYRLVPTAAAGALPRFHFWLALVGLLIFVPSLGMILAGPRSLLTQAEIGIFAASFMVIASMITFAIIVFRNTGKTAPI